MATISADWTENQSLTAFDDTSPADGVTANTTLDIAAAGFIEADIQLEWTENGAASGTSTIEVFGSTNSGTKVDTIPFLSFSVTSTATTQRVSFIVKGKPHITIKFTNDTGQETTVLAGIYAGLKYTDA